MTKVFNDFSGGWRGTLDLAKIPDNMYEARNLIVYRDGSIGPRPGIRSFDYGRTNSGKIHAAFYRGGAQPVMFVEGTDLWAVDDDNTGNNLTDKGNIAAEPDNDWPVVIVRPTDRNGHLIVPGDDFYRIGSGGGITASGMKADTTMDAGFAVAQYGDLVVLAGLPADHARPRIHFCEPGDAFTWDPLDFIDLVTLSSVVYMSAQRNFLSILNAEGSWIVLTGTPAINEVVRKVSNPALRPAPVAPTGAMLTPGDETIYFLSPVNNYPTSFDGATYKEMPYLSMTPEDPSASYADDADPLEPYRQVAVVQGVDNTSVGFILKDPVNRMLLKQRGSWHLHEFAVDMGIAWGYDSRGRMFGFGPQETIPTPGYTMDFRLERPAFTSDTHAQPGDLSDTPLNNELILAEQWTEEGDEFLVSEIIIDARLWDTGVANDSFTVKVEALSRGSEIADAEAERDWTIDATGFSTTEEGTPRRIRINFGDQTSGAGYRVTFTDLVGVAFRQIIVVDGAKDTNSRVF